MGLPVIPSPRCAAWSGS